ncbi:MAG: myo-inositol catabolism IolB protein [Gammaproteobacteria bacterium]|nr:MAG: myo-inositol catabolism IolB protein [Gammaproteobacteria bacterium]
MTRHISAYDNANEAIVAEGNEVTPLVYFNRVCLQPGERYSHWLRGHESCIVPVSGSCSVKVGDESYENIGSRRDLWEGVPNAVYVPVDMPAEITAGAREMEVFIAGGRYDRTLKPFAVRDEDVDLVQYGSDDTKTHRKIKHLLGQRNAADRGRLLVSELFTVGQGGWSGFPPHKHDTERLPEETRFEEVYQFRFRPEQGFGCQFDYLEDGGCGTPHHVRNGDTCLIDRGYHPCVVAPGYEMYYFTIIVGEHSQSLIQYFEPAHAHQIETIPGIKDMIAKFR